MNPMVELQEAFNLVSNPNTQSIRNGEALLKKLKTNNTNYPIFLLNYMKDSNNFEGKLRAAIELRIWTEDYKVTIHFSIGIRRVSEIIFQRNHWGSQI